MKNYKPFEPPYVALSHGIGLVEIAILEALKDTLTKDVLNECCKIVVSRLKDEGIEVTEEKVLEKIKEMIDNGIIKEIAPIVDQLKVWNHMYFVLVKVSLALPVVGIDLEYPTEWEKMEEFVFGLIDDERLRRLIRGIFPLQGTEWDLLLIVTANDMQDLREICEHVTRGGFVEKVWSFEPVKGAKYYFDPVGIPLKEDMQKWIEDLKSLMETLE